MDILFVDKCKGIILWKNNQKNKNSIVVWIKYDFKVDLNTSIYKVLLPV